MSQQGASPISKGSMILPTPKVAALDVPFTFYGNFASGTSPSSAFTNDVFKLALSYEPIEGVDMTDCYYGLRIYKGQRSRTHGNSGSPKSRTSRKGMYHPIHQDGSQWSAMKEFKGSTSQPKDSEWPLEIHTAAQNKHTVIGFDPWQYFRGRQHDGQKTFPVFHTSAYAGNFTQSNWGGLHGQHARRNAKHLLMEFFIFKPDPTTGRFHKSAPSNQIVIFPILHPFNAGDSGFPEGNYFTNWAIKYISNR